MGWLVWNRTVTPTGTEGRRPHGTVEISMDPADSTPLKSGQMDRKRKMIETFWIFWAIMLVGFTNAILGPTVVSLLSVTNSPISYINWIFVLQGLGFILGILGAAMLTRVVIAPVILSASIFFASFVNAALPWMRSFPALGGFVFTQFLLKGIVDYGAMYLCGLLWPRDNDVPFQFISVGVGLAAFIAPFFAYPVLSKEAFSETNHGISGGASTLQCETPSDSLLGNASLTANLFPAQCMAQPTNVDNIYIPFLIIAVVMLPPGVAFGHYAVSDNKPEETTSNASYDALPEFESEEGLLKKRTNFLYWLVLCLLMVFYVPYGGVLITFSHLLAAFGMKSQLHLSASTMALMTSVYWGCFLLGRLLNTLFSTYLNQFVINLCNFVGLFVSIFILVFLAGESEPALWVGTALMSLFNSGFLPGVMTWIGSYVSLEGNAICLSLVGVAIGELFIPFLAGYAFNIFGSMSLMYMVLGMSIFEFAVFVILCIIVCAKLKDKDGGGKIAQSQYDAISLTNEH
ncbi:sodium-dependent glucose transporter 1A-like [Liolophura sinensis]|uniref:sodium-dependent glucose transporter 1A-like n=1 Tax=Liolophura sinensis TaxID=3198878 RepID=UPI0031597B89